MIKLPKTGDTLLGKYLLERQLGEGGMGVVFAARHDLLGQRVAVKLIQPSYLSHADSVARFLNEARAAARIENDHIARVLDVGMIDGKLPYMVLEYLDGADLAELLRRRGPLPSAEVADHVLQAIEGVAHAHALGIIHRDLKPSNLFLAKRPDATARIKVLDFGISKFTGTEPGTSMTRSNTSMGSPLYMSPEQLRDAKGVDQRSDIWALGVIAYELLTGRTPFIADNAVALFAAIQESQAQSTRTMRSPGVIAPDFDGAILKCLRRAPDERFSSVTGLAIALAPFGTNIGLHAVENTKRILPIRDRDARSAKLPRDGAYSSSQYSAQPQISIAASTVVTPMVQTDNPWTKRSPGGSGATSITTRKWMRLVMATSVVAVGLIATAIGIQQKNKRSNQVASITSVATETGTASSVLGATSSFDPEKIGPPGAAPTMTASANPSSVTSSIAIATPTATAGAATTNSAPIVSAASAVTVPASARPTIGATGTASAKSPRHPSKPCTAYVIDANGLKTWNPECL